MQLLNFIFITNKPDLANFAFNNGATRIMVDTEINGKIERQKGLNTLISDHKIEDIKAIKKINEDIPVICRINPVYSETRFEIEQAILNGADFIMLPMFKSNEEVKFVNSVIAKRVKLILLFETLESLLKIDEITSDFSFDEAHIGLNDLSIAFGSNFMFEILTSGIVEYMSNYFVKNKIPFGIGGIAKYDEGIAKSQLIISEHARLGSTSVILSRSFHEYSQNLDELTKRVDFSHEIELLKKSYLLYLDLSLEKLNKNKNTLVKQVYKYLNK